MTLDNICILFGDITLVKRKIKAFIVGFTSYNAHILNRGRLSYWHKQKSSQQTHLRNQTYIRILVLCLTLVY